MRLKRPGLSPTAMIFINRGYPPEGGTPQNRWDFLTKLLKKMTQKQRRRQGPLFIDFTEYEVFLLIIADHFEDYEWASYDESPCSCLMNCSLIIGIFFCPSSLTQPSKIRSGSATIKTPKLISVVIYNYPLGYCIPGLLTTSLNVY